MSKLPEESREKPVYETPVVVDLDTIQHGEGGAIPGCVSGSADVDGCVNGTAAGGGCSAGGAFF